MARLVVVDPPRPVEGPEAADVVDDTALRDAMARLTPPEAEALTLWAWEGLAPAEIAVALGVTPNAVSIRLHRAKIHLREALELHDRKDHDGTPDRNGSRGGASDDVDHDRPGHRAGRATCASGCAAPTPCRRGPAGSSPTSLEVLVSELTRTPVEPAAPAPTRSATAGPPAAPAPAVAGAGGRRGRRRWWWPLALSAGRSTPTPRPRQATARSSPSRSRSPTSPRPRRA